MKRYNVLVYGSGAREHALAAKISQSPLLGELFLALPNDGFKHLGEEIKFLDFNDLAEKCVNNSIDLVVVGPEQPLADGIVDIFNRYSIKCIGANKFWTQLESSKVFAKEFMKKHDLPTAEYAVLKNTLDMDLSQFEEPPVIKADGLAAGKGVHISDSFEDVRSCIADFLQGKFGGASKTVLLEERLYGEEISLISFFDGKTLLPLIPARDYKKLLDGNKGPNTGGMGAFCPVVLAVEEQKQIEKYLNSLENALRQEKADFCGIIYSGLILTKNGIKVLEFNMRFGDPETQALLMHLESDLLDLFIKMTQKRLDEVKLEWKQGTSLCLVLASSGYPQNPKINDKINFESEENIESSIFFAGVKEENDSFITSGGRVLSICANGENIDQCREKVYFDSNKIDFNNKVFRSDIGL